MLYLLFLLFSGCSYVTAEYPIPGSDQVATVKSFRLFSTADVAVEDPRGMKLNYGARPEGEMAAQLLQALMPVLTAAAKGSVPLP